MAEKKEKIQSSEPSQSTKEKKEVWYAGLPQRILSNFPYPPQVTEKFDVTIVDERFVFTPKKKPKT